MLRTSLAALLALAVSAIATHAAAAEPDDGEPPAPAEQAEATEATSPEKSRSDLLLTAGLGGFTDTSTVGGLLSVTALRQKGLLGYGATFEYGGAVLDYTTTTAAPLVGIFIDGPHAIRLGLAATGGLHHYEGVGRGFIFSTDPGASGTTAFVGARAFVGTEVGGKTRFHIGLQLSVDDDLTRTRTPYVYRETGWTSPHSATASHTVGALRFGTLLALGTAFDL
jgi:hypothetical protein